MRPVKSGKSVRMSYSRQKEVLEMPNLIEIQKDSYQWFLDEGLKEIFEDISPISDFAGHLSLEFLDFKLCRDEVKYSIEECRSMGINDSMIHEDFMIGSHDTDITGITADGREVPIFRNGGWAF